MGPCNCKVGVASAAPEAEELTFQEIQQLNDRKNELKRSYSEYVRAHPEIRSLLNDFMCAVLMEKPEDIFEFAHNHFGAMQPPRDDMPKGHTPLIVCGPLGVGRATLIQGLKNAFPERVISPVRTTTRPQSAGEKDGSDFIFLSREAMTADLENGKLIEHETIDGELYGTSFSSINDAVATGKVCVLALDVEQAQTATEGARLEGMRLLFVRPPTSEAMADRLRAKGVNEMRIPNLVQLCNEDMAFAKSPHVGAVVVNAVLKSAMADFRSAVVEWYPHLERRR